MEVIKTHALDCRHTHVPNYITVEYNSGEVEDFDFRDIITPITCASWGKRVRTALGMLYIVRYMYVAGGNIGAEYNILVD